MKVVFTTAVLTILMCLITGSHGGVCSSSSDNCNRNNAECGVGQHRGCCKCGNCGSTECGNCASCTKVANPPFTQQCAANMVLVIDESGSIGNFRAEVASAASSFWTSLGAILNVGGTATLGVIEFSSSARLVKGPLMRDVTPAYITELDQYVNSQSSGTNGYSPGGCTDWGEALDLVRTTNWVDSNGPRIPDIVIFFTDGVPTIFNGECNRDCPAGTSFSTVGGYGDVDDIAVSCYAADRLKTQGTKIFLVGVGGVAGNDYKMEGVTGTVKWDQQVSTFATSDYIPDPDLNNLGAILYNVAVGLCPCLQQQQLCLDDQTDYGAGLTRPCITQWSARVRISSVGSSVSYPAFGESIAYMYYDFSSSVVQRVGYQFFDPASVMGGPAGLPPILATAAPYPVWLRQDVHNPCEVTRKVECTSGCFFISDKQYIPRLFHERSDTLDTSNIPANPSTCSVKYAKQLSQTNPKIPNEIAYIWGEDVPGQGFILCAAVSNDGTIFEFLDATVPTQNFGVTLSLSVRPNSRNNAQNQPDFSFDTQSGGNCLTPVCGANVELVFVFDEQSAVQASDFSAFRAYANGIVDLFDEKPLIRFASAYSNNLAPTFDAFQNNHQSYKNSVTGHVKENTPGGTTDFSALITSAVNNAWPAPKTTASVARHLVVLIGGPDSRGTPPSGTDPWPAVRSLLDARGVETWGVGVGAGGSNVALLTEFVSPKSTHGYFHGVQFPDSNLLQFDIPAMGSRLCPGDASLCDGCNGFCACPGDCRCPACVSTPCGARQCLSPQTGCVGDSFACTDNDICTTDVCIVDPTQMSGRRCTHTPVVCDDFNPCTDDSCVANVGCVHQPKICNDNDVCTDDSCVAGTCVFTPKATCAAICSPNPCPTDGTNCTDHYCIFEDAVPATPVAGALYCSSPEVAAKGAQAVTDCRNDLTMNQFHCFDTPPKTCPGNPCNTETCDAFTGQCVPDTSTNCDDTDPCTIDTCDPNKQGNPCVNTPVVCPLLDQCVTRTCSPVANAATGLPYTCVDGPQVNCSTPDLCSTAKCNPAQGCVVEPTFCNVSSPCNIGQCDPNTGACQEEVLATLLDFCGKCNGDNIGCFFQDFKDLERAGGLVAGAIAGIVIAAVIALLIAAWLSKKGYDHFAASGQLASAGANVNPTFKDNAGARGSTGGVFN